MTERKDEYLQKAAFVQIFKGDSVTEFSIFRTKKKPIELNIIHSA